MYCIYSFILFRYFNWSEGARRIFGYNFHQSLYGRRTVTEWLWYHNIICLMYVIMKYACKEILSKLNLYWNIFIKLTFQRGYRKLPKRLGLRWSGVIEFFEHASHQRGELHHEVHTGNVARIFFSNVYQLNQIVRIPLFR